MNTNDLSPRGAYSGVYTCQCCKTPYSNPKNDEEPLVFLVPGPSLELKVITHEPSSQSCELSKQLVCIHCIVDKKLKGIIPTQDLEQATKGTPVENYVTQVVTRAAFFELFMEDTFLKKYCKKPLQNRVVACFNKLSPENKRVVKVAIDITNVLDTVSALGSLLSGIGAGVFAFKRLSNRIRIPPRPIALRIIKLIAAGTVTLAGVVALGLATSITLLVLRERASNKLYPRLVEKTVSYLEAKQQT